MTSTTPAAPLKVALKPFKGDLPKRKGPNERKATPYDEIMATLLPPAGETEGPPMLAEAKYSDPAELKPTVNQLRSALEFVDADGVYGLRTWIVEAGVIFRVGPRVRRQKPAQGAAA